MMTQPNSDEPKSASTWLQSLSALSLMTKARFGMWDLNDFALYELADVGSIMLFIGAFAWFQSPSLEKFPFAIYVETTSGVSGENSLDSKV